MCGRGQSKDDGTAQQRGRDRAAAAAPAENDSDSEAEVTAERGLPRRAVAEARAAVVAARFAPPPPTHPPTHPHIRRGRVRGSRTGSRPTARTAHPHHARARSCRAPSRRLRLAVSAVQTHAASLRADPYAAGARPACACARRCPECSRARCSVAERRTWEGGGGQMARARAGGAGLGGCRGGGGEIRGRRGGGDQVGRGWQARETETVCAPRDDIPSPPIRSYDPRSPLDRWQPFAL